MTPTEPRPRLLVAGGTGRLGSAIVRGAQARGFPVVGVISGRSPVGRRQGADRGPRVLSPDALPDALAEADVFVSASTPLAEAANLPVVAAQGIPAVVATTGLAGAAQEALRDAARQVPVVSDANFSLGAQLLLRLAETLGPLPPGYDLSITETHRRDKRDHPSGTARALARALEVGGAATGWSPASGAREPGRVEIASLRGGDVPGRHELLLAGPNEVLRLEHWAFGREAFADGVLASAAWLSSPAREPSGPGLFSLRDVLGWPSAADQEARP